MLLQTDLTESHTEVVLLQSAPGRVSPVLAVLGLETGTSAQAELPRVTGRVHTGQPGGQGGVQGPGQHSH